MHDSPKFAENDIFPTTDWTGVIEIAQKGNQAEAEQALEAFCLRYRSVIYQFIRRRGITHENAEDLVQAFFATKVLKQWSESQSLLHRARRDSGHRFRAFLSHAVICFLNDEWRRRSTLKSGGATTFVPLDVLDMAESTTLPAMRSPVEQEFDRAYARSLIDLACQRDARGQHFLSVLRGEKTQAQIGAQLGLSAGAVKVAYHRFARRLGERIRAEVERTVGPDPNETADEIRYLMALSDG